MPARVTRMLAEMRMQSAASTKDAQDQEIESLSPHQVSIFEKLAESTFPCFKVIRVSNNGNRNQQNAFGPCFHIVPVAAV